MQRRKVRRLVRSCVLLSGVEAHDPQIVVEKLTKNVNEAHLREIFGAYGPIKDIDLPMNRQCTSSALLALPNLRIS